MELHDGTTRPTDPTHPAERPELDLIAARKAVVLDSFRLVRVTDVTNPGHGASMVRFEAPDSYTVVLGFQLAGDTNIPDPLVEAVNRGFDLILAALKIEDTDEQNLTKLELWLTPLIAMPDYPTPLTLMLLRSHDPAQLLEMLPVIIHHQLYRAITRNPALLREFIAWCVSLKKVVLSEEVTQS